MTDAIAHSGTAIHLFLLQASIELVKAKLQLRQKDSAENRVAVAARLAEIDTLLDVYLTA